VSYSVPCSQYMYILNCTIAGIYNQGYPGTNQALKVSVAACWCVGGCALQLCIRQGMSDHREPVRCSAFYCCCSSTVEQRHLCLCFTNL
jgi:hypothetical protein